MKRYEKMNEQDLELVRETLNEVIYLKEHIHNIEDKLRLLILINKKENNEENED